MSVLSAVVLLVKVTLVLGGAWALVILLRRRTAAARHDVWASALLAAAVLVVLGRLAPAIELPWIPALGADGAVTAPRQLDDARSAGTALEAVAAMDVDTARSTASGSQSATDATSAVPLPGPTDATAATRAGRPRAGSLAAFAAALVAANGAMAWAGALWAAGIVAVLLWCLAGHLGLRRLARAATPLGGAEWVSLLAETAARVGVQRPVELRASAAIGTPVTWGAWRPLVVLPAEAGSWPVERRRAALLHELAHVARHDYLAQLGGTLACALYWFHPAAWMAVRRLRLESERACDDRVLASDTSPEEYAAQLLEVARGARALRNAGGALAIGMARPSTLEGRLLAVLDESVPRRTTTPRVRLAACLLAAIVLVPLAGLTPVARGEVAADTVSGGKPPDVSVHPSGSGGAGVSASAPLPTTGEKNDKDWRPEAPEAPPAQPAQAIDQSVAASPGEELFLDLETGAGVAITGWDEPRVEVHGRLGGPDWRDSRVEVGRGEGGARVRLWPARRSGSQSTSHRLTIRVPRRFDVRLRSSGGDLAIDGVEGRFEGSTGGGDITLTHLRGSAHLSTGGGTVRVDDCHLAGSVTTGGGPITLSRVSGGLRGSSGSGPVVYREPAEGEGEEGETGSLEDLELDADGDVDLGGIDSEAPASTGRLHISRAGGDVRLAGAPDGAVIHTGGGEIVVGRSAGLVDASTGGGDVTIGPVAGSVRAGTGAGRVEVTLVEAGGEEQSVEIKSGNGRVLLVLPAGFDGTIELETAYTERHGPTRITAPWELQRTLSDWESDYGTPRRFVRARGTVGNGRGGYVRVKTVNGDVEVRER
jgi:beta-lactamase regulating signal transducer with metallopeptidase domain/DUF4097 and DUF4098 domain-containing protein YvlB